LKSKDVRTISLDCPVPERSSSVSFKCPVAIFTIGKNTSRTVVIVIAKLFILLILLVEIYGVVDREVGLSEILVDRNQLFLAKRIREKWWLFF
jgi:hypothetical protein